MVVLVQVPVALQAGPCRLEHLMQNSTALCRETKSGAHVMHGGGGAEVDTQYARNREHRNLCDGLLFEVTRM